MTRPEDTQFLLWDGFVYERRCPREDIEKQLGTDRDNRIFPTQTTKGMIDIPVRFSIGHRKNKKLRRRSRRMR